MECNRFSQVESRFSVKMLDLCLEVRLGVGEGILTDRLPSELGVRLGHIFVEGLLFGPKGEGLRKEIERFPVVTRVEKRKAFLIQRSPSRRDSAGRGHLLLRNGLEGSVDRGRGRT